MVERTWETKKSLLHTKMRNHITLSPGEVQRMKEMEWRCVDCLLARSRQPCRKPRTEAGNISTALRSGHKGPTAVLPVRLTGPLSRAFPQVPGVTELQREPTSRACTWLSGLCCYCALALGPRFDDGAAAWGSWRGCGSSHKHKGASPSRRARVPLLGGRLVMGCDPRGRQDF